MDNPCSAFILLRVLFAPLQRDVAVFFLRNGNGLVFEHGECLDEFAACNRRLDDLIYETSLGCKIRIGELLDVFGFLFLKFAIGVGCFVDLLAEYDFCSTFSAHNGNLGSWPGVIHIGSDVFGVHNIVSSTVCFAGDECDTWYGGFAECLQELGSVGDDTVPFLVGAGQETRYVNEYEQWYVEAVAEAYETGCLFG